jgi:hypothetical protein
MSELSSCGDPKMISIVGVKYYNLYTCAKGYDYLME